MDHDLTKPQKRALRAAAQLAHDRDRSMSTEDRQVHYLEARNADLPIVVGGAVANGIIGIDDVEVTARDLIADFAERIRAVMNARVTMPVSRDDEEEVEDPTAAVSVAAIVDEADLLSEESTLYVNRRTGAVIIISDEFMDDDAEEDDDDDTEEDDDDDSEGGEGNVPDWLRQARAESRAIVENPDWCPLLGRDDLDDFDTMKRFARNAGPAASRDLFDALSGRGVRRRFRDVIHRRGLEDEWEVFRANRLADLIRFLLKERGIPFRK